MPKYRNISLFCDVTPCGLVVTHSVSEKLTVSTYIYPKCAGSRYLRKAIRFLPDNTAS